MENESLEDAFPIGTGEPQTKSLLLSIILVV